MKPAEPGDPSEIAGLTVLGRLGVGGMGVVYLARQPQGGLVALKVVRPELSGNPEFSERFTREVRNSIGVRGPFLVETVEASTSMRPQFLATRYVPGVTLKILVQEHGPLSETEAAALGVAVADSLQRLHSAALVHRDITPANIQVGAAGPIVLDLGIARTSDATSLTLLSSSLGTPAWTPPEQLRGAPQDYAGDMWNWGALTAFALTGEHPLGAATHEAIAYRILNEDAVIPATSRPLASLLAAALDREPSNRPTAAEVTAALLPTGESAPAFVAPRWARPAALSQGAGDVGGAAADVTAPFLAPTRLDSSPQLAERRRLPVAAFIAAAVVMLVAAIGLARASAGDAEATTVAQMPSAAALRAAMTDAQARRPAPSPSATRADPAPERVVRPAPPKHAGKPKGPGKGHGHGHGHGKKD